VELLLAAIMLFVFSKVSRNALNISAKRKNSGSTNQRLVQVTRCPIWTRCTTVLCRPPDTELEHLKHTLVKTLLEKKVLHNTACSSAGLCGGGCHRGGEL